jgi:hypothetical protein
MGRKEFESTAAHTHKHQTKERTERKNRQHTIKSEFLIFPAGSRMENRSINTSGAEGSLRQQQQQTGSSERENKVLEEKKEAAGAEQVLLLLLLLCCCPGQSINKWSSLFTSDLMPKKNPHRRAAGRR